MRRDLLHVIAARSNPIQYGAPERIYKDWVEHMLDSGVRLTVVECQYGERPFVNELPGVNHVKVRAKTLLWSKERLLNIALSRLPEDWKYVAWIDSDVFFRQKNWAYDAVQALQIYEIIQPWSDCYDLGPKDEHMLVHRSFGRIHNERKPIMQGPNLAEKAPYAFAHPGYAWASTKHFLDVSGGFVDHAILGAGDHHQAMALIGRVKDSIPNNCTDGYKAPLYRWQERVCQADMGARFSYIPGTIEHRFHGPKEGRAYRSRWEILSRHRFDPATDLKPNVWGCWELAGNKPEMMRDINLYFRSRDEDSNQM